MEKLDWASIKRWLDEPMYSAPTRYIVHPDTYKRYKDHVAKVHRNSDKECARCHEILMGLV
jgi:hypothetical protein